MLEFLSEAQDLISQDLEIGHQENLDDYTKLLKVIESRVLELLDSNEELLFSYLYRLDISEPLLKAVLANDHLDKIKAISRLILDRQLLRIKTKKSFPQQPLEGWDW